MNKDGSRVWWMISLDSAGYGGSQAAHLLRLYMVFQSIWGWGDLCFSSFFNKILHQKEPEILVGILSPT